MKRHAPLLTLLAVALLGVGLLVVTAVSNPANRTTAGQAAAPPAQEPSAGGRGAGAAPAPEAAPGAPVVTERAYAGRTEDRRLTVAVAVKDGRAVAYVCDGKRVESWLEGRLDGAALTLSGRNDAKLTGTVGQDRTVGTFTANGRSWTFTARGVDSPAGLYEGRATRGVTARIGWVVEQDGTVTGVVNRDGATAAAPRLDPADPAGVTLDGVPVEVRSLGGDAQVIR